MLATTYQTPHPKFSIPWKYQNQKQFGLFELSFPREQQTSLTQNFTQIPFFHSSHHVMNTDYFLETQMVIIFVCVCVCVCVCVGGGGGGGGFQASGLKNTKKTDL
jgi:hypothetical protein